ncbi:hypothetical protein BJX99DRAFT_255370 [Aspergillus californicus]
MTRHRKKLNLQCEFCPKRYTKREHLQRHERIHTGVKPFACTVCGRCFSRQDVLNRHLRVHSSAGTSQMAATDGISSQITPQSQSAQGWAPISGLDLPENLPGDCAPLYETPVDDARSLPVDLASGLLWPDSEELLHNIMSIDPAIWQQPLALAPSTLGMMDLPSELMSTGYHDSPTSTIADDGRQAIQSLSSMISDTFSKVTAPASLTGLTSRFLDGSLHMFFENIVPMFPIFHRPTFVFRDCAPPLLLNAIALGALFLGSEDAISKADVLWRLAHTAVATSWHTMIMRKRPYDTCSGVELVQTVLLSQIYAALSKNRTFRTTSQVFHGLGIHWASHCGMYDALEAIPLPSLSDTSRTKQQTWQQWIAHETMLRTLLGLYIVDGVVSQFSGNPTFARHTANPLNLPSCHSAFAALSPETWISQMQRHPTSCIRFCDVYHDLFQQGQGSSPAGYDISLFHHKVVLEGIRCLVSEMNRTKPPPIGMPSRKDLLLVLRQLRQNILNSQILTPTDRLTALLQWHSICLDTVVSTARGTRRMCHLFGIKQGIFGGSQREESSINPAKWTQSLAGRATLLHAINMQAIAAQLPLGLAYDVNIPGAVFAAATTNTSFTLAGVSKVVFPAVIDWDTALMALQVDSGSDMALVRDGLEGGRQYTLDFISGTFDVTEMRRDDYVVRDLSYDLIAMRTLLRGLSLQWGVAVEMEEVVSSFIDRCQL